jgi:hypothetical protein
LISFLEILTSTSEQEAPESGQADSGAATDSEATMAGRAVSPQEDTQLLSATGDEIARGTVKPSSVDRQNPSPAQRMIGDESGPRANSGVPGVANGESGIATTNGRSMPIHSAATVVSPYVMPQAQNSASGNTFQKTLANASGLETSEDVSMNSGANTVAGVRATSRPASGYGTTSTVSVAGKSSDGSKTAAAPVDQKEPSTEQTPSAPENGRLTKVESLGLVKEESMPATSKLKGVLAFSTAESVATTASPLKRTSPSVDTDTQIPAGASVQRFSRSGVMSDGKKTLDESSSLTRVASQRQAIPVPSITVKGSGIATATRSADQDGPGQTRPSAPGRSQLPTATTAAVLNGVVWRSALDDRSVSPASAANVTSLPAQSLEWNVAAAGTSPRTTAGDSALEISAGGPMDTGERSPGSKLNAPFSAPVKFASSTTQSPAQTRPSVNAPERTLVSEPELNRSGIQSVEVGSRAYPGEMRVVPSAPVKFSGSSSQLPTQTGALGSAPQRLIPDGSDRHLFGNVLIDTTGKAQVNQTHTFVSPTTARSITSAPAPATTAAPAQVIQFGKLLEPTLVSAPAGQDSGKASILSGAERLTEVPSEAASTLAKTSGSTALPNVRTRPNVDTDREITRSTSGDEAPEKTRGNANADAQARETSVLASSAVAAPISFAQTSAMTRPISEAIAPVHVSAEAPERHVSASGLVDDGSQRISEGLSEAASTLAKTAGSIPQSAVEARQTVVTVPEITRNTSDREAPKNILPNTIADAQASETTVLASSAVTLPVSFAQPAVMTQPVSDAIAPEQASAQVPEGRVSGSNFADDRARRIPIELSVSNPDPATISGAPSQPRMQTISSGGTIELLPSNAPTQDASENGPIEKRVEADEITGWANQLSKAQSPSEVENGSAPIAAAALPVDHDMALPDKARSGQENGTRTEDGSPAAPAQIDNVHAAPIAQEAAPKQFISPSVPDIASPQQTKTTQQSAMPPKPLSQTVPQIASVDGKPATAANSSARTSDRPEIAASAAEEVFMPPIDLPMIVVPATSENGKPPAGNAVEKAESSASGPGNPQVANAADAAIGKTTDTKSGSGDTSQHGVQNTPQSSQGPQADPSHTADSAPRTSESGASLTQVQPQTVPMQAQPADTATAHRVSDASEVATRSGEQQGVPASIHSDGGELAATSSINTAKLMQTMSESEMHVGMRSSEFGDISIRTSITDQQMVTRISLDHSELSQAISAHVSSMQTKLGEDSGLNASIEVHNLGSSHSGEPGQSSQREQRALHQSSQNGNALFPPEEETGMSMAALVNAGNGNRLDIRA